MRLSLIAAALMLASPLASHADTIFNLNATLTTGTITGTLTLNAASTAFSAIDLTFQDTGPFPAADHFTTIGQQGPSTSSAYLVESVVGPDALNLFIAVPTLTSYQGSAICSLMAPCYSMKGANSSFIYEAGNRYNEAFATGSLTPVLSASSVTPEPSSIALLGTGVLGLAGMIRRRLRIT